MCEVAAMRQSYLAIIMTCLIMLSGCGMNGPLYLPDKDHPQPTQPDPNEPTWF